MSNINNLYTSEIPRRNPAPCPHRRYRPDCQLACGCGHACLEHDASGECTVEDCGCTDLFANT